MQTRILDLIVGNKEGMMDPIINLKGTMEMIENRNIGKYWNLTG